MVFAVSAAAIQTQAAEQYFAGDGSALNTAKYSTSASGPFTSSFTSGNIIGFGVANGTGTGASITVGGFDALENFTLTSTGGTLSTGGKVVGISVADGKTLNLGSEGISTMAGTGFIKSGNGTYASGGGTFAGGFTLGAGTVVALSINAFGSGAGNTLTINGGTLAAGATANFSGKYTGGIMVGGDFQLGALTTNVALSNSAANLTFSDALGLGAATRAITIGGNGVYTLASTISGSSGVGITTSAVATATGSLRLTGTNAYSGATTINGGTVEITVLTNGSSNSSLGSSSNAVSNLVLNGGILSYIGTTAGSTDRNITLGANGGGLVASGTIPTGLTGATNAANGSFVISGNITAPASSGTQTLSLSGNNGTNNGAGVLSGVVSDGNGTNMTAIAKNGTGTWTLAGANTYTGTTTATSGTLLVNGSTSATSAVSVNGGTLGGTGLVNGLVAVAKGATLQGGVGTPTGALTLSNSPTLSSGSVVQLALDGSLNHSTLSLPAGSNPFNSNQAFNFTGTPVDGTYDNIITGVAAGIVTSGWTINNGFNSFTFTDDGSNIDLMITDVPEPTTALSGLLLIGALSWNHRRRLGGLAGLLRGARAA